MNKFDEIEKETENKYTISEWLQFANNFWVFTGTFEGLSNYKTLDQKKKDKIVRTLIDEIIKEHYIENWKNKIKKQLDVELDGMF